MFLQSRLCSLLPKPLGSRQTFSLSVRRTAGRPSTSVKGERFILVETSECGFYLEAHIVGASLGFSLFIHFHWYYIISGDNCTFFAVVIQIVFSHTSLTLFVSDWFLEIRFSFLSFIICSFLLGFYLSQPARGKDDWRAAAVFSDAHVCAEFTDPADVAWRNPGGGVLYYSALGSWT